MLKKTVCGLLLSLGSVCAFAVPHVMTKDISGFNAMITSLQKQNISQVAILFPMGVPRAAHGVMYYPNFDVNNNGYNIYLDSTANCKGAHYCNLMTLSASNNVSGELPTYKNQQGQVLTKQVHLLHGVVANYTPGFALGDYWNPQISWRQNNATYTLSWVGTNNAHQTQGGMVKMANHIQKFNLLKASGS